MNRFKCPACGGEQYTSLDEVSGCIHCDYTGPLEKKDHLEPAIRRAALGIKWGHLKEGIING